LPVLARNLVFFTNLPLSYLQFVVPN